MEILTEIKKSTLAPSAPLVTGEEVGIIGAGMVGGVLKRYYPQSLVFDIKPGIWADLSELLKRRYIFIAVNFPDNCASQKNRRELIDYFRKIPKGARVIIKSTFVPGTTDYFQKIFPELVFCYNPEFLTENTAWKDFTYPQFQILGLPAHQRYLADEIFSILPPAPITKIIEPKNAEALKHAMNSYFATKVIFFNELYNAAKLFGADYEEIRQLMIQHPWVGNSHSEIWHKGYRGFGGKCLPKDIRALAKLSASPLFKKVIEINESLQ